jgi:hypothetical protein
MWSKYYRVGFYGAMFDDLDNKYGQQRTCGAPAWLWMQLTPYSHSTSARL